jgi:hypothetical protein
MKKIILVITLLCLFALIVSGCSSTQTDTTQEKKPDLYDVKEAIKEEKPETDVEVTESIRYQTLTINENGTVIIIEADKLLNKVDIEIQIPWDFPEESEAFFSGDGLKNFSLTLGCGIMQLGFFNETGLKEFQETWNNASFTIQEDDELVTEPDDNAGNVMQELLNNAKISNVRVNLVDVVSNKSVGSCDIRGPAKEDIVMRIN